VAPVVATPAQGDQVVELVQPPMAPVRDVVDLRGGTLAPLAEHALVLGEPPRLAVGVSVVPVHHGRSAIDFPLGAVIPQKDLPEVAVTEVMKLPRRRGVRESVWVGQIQRIPQVIECLAYGLPALRILYFMDVEFAIGGFWGCLWRGLWHG